MELKYPPASQQPSPTAAGEAAGKARPSFADVLAASLVPTSEMRAWYSEERGYQALRQTRVPLTLPQVRRLTEKLCFTDFSKPAWSAAYPTPASYQLLASIISRS